MSINEYRWISRFLESSSLKKTMKQNNEKQWKTMQKTFKNNKTTMKHYEQPALAGPAGPAQALGLSRHRRQRGRRPQRRQPANNVKRRVFHCFHFSLFFIVFSLFFHGFFKELDFKELEIHQWIHWHPSMNSLMDHRWISLMDIHQWTWSPFFAPLLLLSFLWALSLGPMGGPKVTCMRHLGTFGVWDL